MINTSAIENTEFRTVLLDVFKYFISICEKHNLKYYCSGGTAIGAVRHHGMIPWDDDIDVLMPRNDYCVFLSLRPLFQKDGFDVSYIGNDPAASLTKFFNANTTVWELKQIPFVCGVCLDIFPMDEVNYGEKVFLKEYDHFRFLCRLYQLSRMKCSIYDAICFKKEHNRKLFIKGLLSNITPRFISGFLRRKIIQFEERHKNGKGEFYASFYGDYREKEFFPKEWFSDRVSVHFSDFEVTLPIKWDEYLSYVFGDYMQLPPEEKRVAKHYQYYINLKEGLTLDQIVSKSKRIE